MTRSLLLATALGLAACEQRAPDAPVAPDAPATPPAETVTTGPLTITDAYTPPAPASGTGGLFFTITGGAEADTLRSITFAGAERSEIHESYDAGDGMHGMRPVAGVPVSPGGATALAPGGTHVMMMNLASALAPGDTVRAEATFDRAGAVPVVAVVRTLEAIPHVTAP